MTVKNLPPDADLQALMRAVNDRLPEGIRVALALTRQETEDGPLIRALAVFSYGVTGPRASRHLEGVPALEDADDLVRDAHAWAAEVMHKHRYTTDLTEADSKPWLD